jgi:Macrocin-O-methyltransferase (TylF).
MDPFQRLVTANLEAWQNFRTRHPILFNSMYPAYRLYKQGRRWRYRQIYNRFKDYTMLLPDWYAANLELCENFGHIAGNVVECGVWKGGMSAGIAYLLGDDRAYYLYDSFEGLPAAGDEDAIHGIVASAKSWEGKLKASEENASEAMKLSGAKRVTIVKGWFSETLSTYEGGPIAILRLDGDFYASVMDSLVNLWPHVVTGGLIILDDYYTWSGCSRAVHDFLSQNELNEPIQQFHETYAYVVKEADTNQSSRRCNKVEASVGVQPH